MLLCSLPMRSRKRLARDVIDTSVTFAPVLFVTSLIQTAEHKMAVLTSRGSAKYKRRLFFFK